ncbi:MAG: YvrJ family protein [Selenomonadaceae bacterium]|nr:YvrJ family protein [Selenomonadaceae bacterium]
MEETVLTHLLSNVGIPAAICFYTLFGVNKTLKELTAAINNLTVDVDKRISKLEDRVDHFTQEVRHDNSQH